MKQFDSQILKIGVITLFPEIFEALKYSITGRAIEAGLLELTYFNPRDYTNDKHHTVDDRPYGGGPGMVLMVEPLLKAIQAAKEVLGRETCVIYLSPQGQRLDQRGVETLHARKNLLFIAGRYEGIDQRVIDKEVDEQWSLGDFVLSGGELAAMSFIDAMMRLQKGALGHEESAIQDSFMDGLLDYPHYTRPEVIADMPVPTVLLSGDHQSIAEWRLKQALGQTWIQRPDLLEGRTLTHAEQRLLNEFISEYEGVSHD